MSPCLSNDTLQSRWTFQDVNFFRGMATMIVVFALLWVGTRAIENFKPSNASTVRFVYLLHIVLPQKYFYSSVFNIFLKLFFEKLFFKICFALHFASSRFCQRYHLSQSRQSAKLLFQSLELELPHPLTRRQCAPPPPLVPMGGGGGQWAHSLAGEGFGGGGGS